ncbi:MAG: hypothetical protein EAZ32_13110 [Cytophagia bacterium]|nr:MAG: hypothetical protein EAZ38_17670 [Cytophagales bacterium]TAG38177.1 MAG: hypothetical protein EAZ32_13110 [Cytophagia bacterium]
MKTRTKHTYRTPIYHFTKNILVVCPNCEGKALVRAESLTEPKPEISKAKIICTSCGYNKTLENILKRKAEKQKSGNVLIFGAPVDPFFHLPVWLQAEFSGEVLWAYNLEHLDFLAAHVGAKLRERNGFQFNVKSIGARLPRWMTAAHNREAILKALTKLKEK